MKSGMASRLLVAMTVAFGAATLGPALAAMSPSEQLADPAQEARARVLGKELRCLVCQNQSIDDSDAELAQDLRRLVRERITAGDDDQEILAYLTDRYGAFVRLRPPVTRATWMLWFGPLALLVVAGTVVLVWRRRQVAEMERPWTVGEQQRLDEALAEVNTPLSDEPGVDRTEAR